MEHRILTAERKRERVRESVCVCVYVCMCLCVRVFSAAGDRARAQALGSPVCGRREGVCYLMRVGVEHRTSNYCSSSSSRQALALSRSSPVWVLSPWVDQTRVDPFPMFTHWSLLDHQFHASALETLPYPTAL
jgi:hypothetical protein